LNITKGSAFPCHSRQDNPEAASRVAIQIVAACDRLEYLPERGRLGFIPNTRELVSCWPYVIVYRIINSSLIAWLLSTVIKTAQMCSRISSTRVAWNG